MGKKTVAVTLAAISALSIGIVTPACVNTPGENTVDEEKIYEKIYDGNAKIKYGQVTGAERYLASYGYVGNDVQGYNNWYYKSGGVNNLKDMRFNSGNNRWEAENGSCITRSVIAPDGENAGFLFKAPVSGRAQISGNIRMNRANEGGAELRVYLNGKKVYPLEDSLKISGEDLTGWFVDFTEELQTGDELYFETQSTGEVYFNPCVDFTGVFDETLYKVPEWGFFGDIHVYYYNGVCNLYQLRTLGNNRWEWYLYTSTDMFRSEEASVYTVDFVENHYMAFSKTENLVDYTTYPDGARDTTKFYDEDVDKYRFIGCTYKDNNPVTMDCDLSMRTSSTGADGYKWETAAVPLRKYPNASGEPEVAGFRKIGKSWYLYTSVLHSSNTHHGGALAYWFGGEGKTIDETDWLNAETHYLDGEDLLGAQIENIAGKWYLYGKLPASYYAAWGGYNNLPREVFRRENGLLGTKLDPMATKLVNKGKVFDVNSAEKQILYGSAEIGKDKIKMTGIEDNRVQVDRECGSNFITYKLNMGTATEAGLVLNDGKRDFKIVLKQEDGKTYMQVESPGDPYHVLNSRLYLGEASQKEYEIKLVVDGVAQGSICEFYVNDTLTLTARTGMGATYKPSLYANGTAEFTGFTVNRLAQYYDIYE